MKRRTAVAAATAALGSLLFGPRRVAARGAPSAALFDDLHDYLSFGDSARDIDPADFVRYLRLESRFRTIDVATVPKHAIILHDNYPEIILDRLGIAPSDYASLQTGDTDPNLLYIVHDRSLDLDFILNRGLPGAGGVTTQAAELYALGVTAITHVGTCGLFGTRIAGGVPIVSAGSYKDAAGVMLSRNRSERLARPDAALRAAITAAFAGDRIAATVAIGYTSPIYYFQPLALANACAAFNGPAGPIEYVEMEAGSLFALAELMQRAAASVVVGVDRYSPEHHHQYLGVDDRAVKATIVRQVLKAYKTFPAVAGTR